MYIGPVVIEDYYPTEGGNNKLFDYLARFPFKIETDITPTPTNKNKRSYSKGNFYYINEECIQYTI
jgi:hypothetical protein